jgi:hypothetical protein
MKAAVKKKITVENLKEIMVKLNTKVNESQTKIKCAR